MIVAHLSWQEKGDGKPITAPSSHGYKMFAETRKSHDPSAPLLPSLTAKFCPEFCRNHLGNIHSKPRPRCRSSASARPSLPRLGLEMFHGKLGTLTVYKIKICFFFLFFFFKATDYLESLKFGPLGAKESRFRCPNL